MHRRNTIIWWLILALTLGWTACEKTPTPETDVPYYLDIPPGFPPMAIPEDNALTVKRIELGKQLFFDPALSRDSTIACGSCHFQELAFAHNVPVTPGIEGRLGFRNSPTLANIGYHPYFFMDGGVPTLEQQVIAPVEDHNEMDFTLEGATERLLQNEDYKQLAEQAYGQSISPFVITHAIAAFERTMISGNSKFDRVVYRGTDSFNASEQRGQELFFSTKTNCTSCHSGLMFTDFSFKNNGLYESYADTGRMRITLLESDRAMFKVPTLRNIELTAPYMHDGSIATLEGVIEHYNSGGQNHPNKDERVRPLNLTEQEKTDLINFLKTLTDPVFVNNEEFVP